MMKPLTLEELKERLKNLDEVSLLEFLGINSEQIVENFSWLIEEQFEKFEKELDEYE